MIKQNGEYITDPGSLVTCPAKHDMGILGKITTDGQFIIKRFHHGFTTIKVQTLAYQIECHCGYILNVNNGTIVTTIQGTI